MAGYGEHYGVGQFGEEGGGLFGPVIQNQRPAAGDTNVARSKPIYLEITDEDDDLSPSSIIIKVNSKVAWKDGAAQPGFAVTTAAIIDGFYFEIYPVGGLPPYGATFVYVYADDGTNSTEARYTFEVGGVITSFRFDDFDDNDTGTGELAVNPLAGNITEPVGSEIELDCPNSANCNWWSGIDQAPKAYFQVKDWMANKRTGVFWVETRLSGYDWTNDYTRAGLFIRLSSIDMWTLEFEPHGGNRIMVHRILDNVGSQRHDDGGKVVPNTTPHIYRILANTNGREIIIDDPDVGAVRMPANGIGFCASWDDGANWELIYSATMADLSLQDVGVHNIKWATGAGDNSQARFDYLEFGEFRMHAQVEASDEPINVYTRVNPEHRIVSPPKQLLEDKATVTDAGGPPAHQLGVGAGQLIPGPVNQSVGSIGSLPKQLLEDTAALPDRPGRTQQHQFPSRGEGLIISGLPEHRDRQFQQLLENALLQSLVSVDADYNRLTTDGYGHAHFTGDRVLLGWYYDTTGELWTTPTDPSFNGYGQDGYEYVAGVQQGGGPHAPWATESSSVNRSGRADFPDRALICYATTGHDGLDDTGIPKEVIIFDLDSLPTQLYMWMRFTFGPSGGSYTMMGRVNQKPTTLWMGNGVLVVGTTEGDYRGALHIIDFKAVGADCGHYMRSNNHYRWQRAGGIADRNVAGSGWNTSGVSPTLLINPEKIESVHGLADGNTTWLACAGEGSPIQMVKIDNSVPSQLISGTGDQGADNIEGTRLVLFDDDGWFWFVTNGALYRNIIDFREGLLYAQYFTTEGRGYNNKVALPYQPRTMVHSKNYIYLGTDHGVYRVDRGSLAIELIYTVSGGGGGGKAASPPAGELIAGSKEAIHHMSRMTISITDYIATASYFTGSATLLRLLDEAVIDGREYPDLSLPGCHFNIIVPD